MIKYKLYEIDSGVVGIQNRVTGDSFIEGESSQWREYQEWLSEGNTPIPLPPTQFHDLVDDEWVVDFERMRSAKMADLYSNVKQFISTQPNGWPRYDDDLKLNVMNASMTAIAAGQAKPANCVAVETWIYTVQQRFFNLKNAIATALTFEALNPIDVSYDDFESKYGRDGTVAADPAVSTDDLFNV